MMLDNTYHSTLFRRWAVRLIAPENAMVEDVWWMVAICRCDQKAAIKAAIPPSLSNRKERNHRFFFGVVLCYNNNSVTNNIIITIFTNVGHHFTSSKEGSQINRCLRA